MCSGTTALAHGPHAELRESSSTRPARCRAGGRPRRTRLRTDDDLGLGIGIRANPYDACLVKRSWPLLEQFAELLGKLDALHLVSDCLIRKVECLRCLSINHDQFNPTEAVCMLRRELRQSRRLCWRVCEADSVRIDNIDLKTFSVL